MDDLIPTNFKDPKDALKFYSLPRGKRNCMRCKKKRGNSGNHFFCKKCKPAKFNS